MQLNNQITNTCTHYETHDDGTWNAAYVNNLEAVTINSQGNMTTDFIVNVGDIVYVIWAEYTSGDANGTGINGNAEAIQIYKTLASANAALALINNSTPTVSLTSEGNNPVSFTKPWGSQYNVLGAVHLSVRFVEI